VLALNQPSGYASADSQGAFAMSSKGKSIWFSWRTKRAALVLAVLSTLLTGCDPGTLLEEQELEQEQKQLQQQQQQLQSALNKMTAGKTTYTNQEKAQIAPVYQQLQQVKAQLGSVQLQLAQLYGGSQ
jgi:outer membrane biogenesis lipoprotein LolB